MDFLQMATGGSTSKYSLPSSSAALHAASPPRAPTAARSAAPQAYSERHRDPASREYREESIREVSGRAGLRKGDGGREPGAESSSGRDTGKAGPAEQSAGQSASVEAHDSPWQCLYDESSGYNYWYNHETGESQWDELAADVPLHRMAGVSSGAPSQHSVTPGGEDRRRPAPLAVSPPEVPVARATMHPYEIDKARMEERLLAQDKINELQSNHADEIRAVRAEAQTALTEANERREREVHEVTARARAETERMLEGFRLERTEMLARFERQLENATAQAAAASSQAAAAALASVASPETGALSTTPRGGDPATLQRLRAQTPMQERQFDHAAMEEAARAAGEDAEKLRAERDSLVLELAAAKESAGAACEGKRCVEAALAASRDECTTLQSRVQELSLEIESLNCTISDLKSRVAAAEDSAGADRERSSKEIERLSAEQTAAVSCAEERGRLEAVVDVESRLSALHRDVETANAIAADAESRIVELAAAADARIEAERREAQQGFADRLAQAVKVASEAARAEEAARATAAIDSLKRTIADLEGCIASTERPAGDSQAAAVAAAEKRGRADAMAAASQLTALRRDVETARAATADAESRLVEMTAAADAGIAAAHRSVKDAVAAAVAETRIAGEAARAEEAACAATSIAAADDAAASAQAEVAQLKATVVAVNEAASTAQEEAAKIKRELEKAKRRLKLEVALRAQEKDEANKHRQEAEAVASAKLEEALASCRAKAHAAMESALQEAKQTAAETTEAAVSAAKKKRDARWQAKIRELAAAAEKSREAAVAAAEAAVQERQQSALEAAVRTARESERAAADIRVAAVEKERDDAKAIIAGEREARRKAYARVLELQGNIRVVARVRPILEVERRAGDGADATVTMFPEPDVVAVMTGGSSKGKPIVERFGFQRCFGPEATQEAVFEEVAPLVSSVMDGFNACIFAYGQTGSGKTHTMEGTESEPGIYIRTLNQLFVLRDSKDAIVEARIRVSVLEVYNEKVRDLLSSGSSDGPRDSLALRLASAGGRGRSAVVVCEGLVEVEVNETADVLTALSTASGNRAVCSHDVNEHSSRSHLVLTIYVDTLRADGSTSRSKLNLVDLAGSERLSKTGATGQALEEAKHINKSLSALGDVIAALGSPGTKSGKSGAVGGAGGTPGHIPYRNSKLTYLLQDSLGGGAKVMMFVNASPAKWSAAETICSLKFAQRCAAVQLGTAKRQSNSAEVASLRRTVEKLESQLRSKR